MTPPPSIGAIAWLVARDSNRTLGGGLASMELIRRSGIARGWFDEADNAVLVAASRLTPGTNVLAYCVGLGWKLRGAFGAAAAVTAASVPAALAVALISATLMRIDGYFVVRALLAAGTIVASALVLSTTWALLRPHVTGTSRAWTALVAMLAVVLLVAGATPVQTLLVAALAGAVIAR